MSKRAPGRYLPLVLIMTLGIAILIAGLWWLNRDDRTGPTDPSPVADGNATAALPAGPSRSVEQEIACVDRLISGNVPPGTNMQAAFEHCRYVPDPNAPPPEANASITDRAAPAPLNAAAGR